VALSTRSARVIAAASFTRVRGAGHCGGTAAVAARMLCASPQAADDVCLIDGHALAYRMHFALQKSAMTTRGGASSHALHGFLNKVIDLHALYPSHRLVVAFDLPGPTFRSEVQSTYKAQRAPMPTPLRPQILAMQEALGHLGVPAITAEGFEADDVIATCVARARKAGVGSVVIVGCDKDLMQLVSEDDEATRVSMWNDQKKAVIDAAAVRAQFGVGPAQMGDLLALMGDASDNVPGVPGVGPKGAAKLLADHADLESVLSAAAVMKPSKRSTALLEFADTARRARALVELRTDVPLDEVAFGGGGSPEFTSEALLEFLRRWELNKVEAKVLKIKQPPNLKQNRKPIVQNLAAPPEE